MWCFCSRYIHTFRSPTACTGYGLTTLRRLQPLQKWQKTSPVTFQHVFVFYKYWMLCRVDLSSRTTMVVNSWQCIIGHNKIMWLLHSSDWLEIRWFEQIQFKCQSSNPVRNPVQWLDMTVPPVPWYSGIEWTMRYGGPQIGQWIPMDRPTCPWCSWILIGDLDITHTGFT